MIIDATRSAFFVFLMYSNFIVAHWQAIVRVPVVDAFGAPYETFAPNLDQTTWNSAMPYMYGGTSTIACPRMHQLLFNEQVEVLQTTEKEAKIRVTSAFYQTPADNRVETVYWIDKKAIAPLSHFDQDARSRLPEPINFQNPATLNNDTCVTLVQPWHDSVTNMQFSAGTRFKQAGSIGSTERLSVWRLIPATNTLESMDLDPQACHVSNPQQTLAERITFFVQLLQSWARNAAHEPIAYVLGGTSFTNRMSDHSFTCEPLPYAPELTGYMWPLHARIIPKTGFDCSGLILRAAQIAGIPYFAKNTPTIASCLQPLTTNHKVAVGDLVLITGHVLVISTLNPATIIEARAYKDGYGRIHELPLDRVFKGITTIDDLVNAHFKRISIDRLNRQGEIGSHFSHLTILRMASAWEEQDITKHSKTTPTSPRRERRKRR